VFVFPDGEYVDRLIEAMQWKNARYQSGVALMDALNVKPPGEDEDQEDQAPESRIPAALGVS
jgi:hypothetical protein